VQRGPGRAVGRASRSRGRAGTAVERERFRPQKREKTMTSRAYNVLSFLADNIRKKVETLREARGFVRGLGDLTEGEKLFLLCALRNPAQLGDFQACFAAHLNGSGRRVRRRRRR